MRCGTSYAAPHVAGLAALILQARPGINPASVKDLIIRTAAIPDTTATPSADWDDRWGWGQVNAYEALALAMQTDLTFPNHPANPPWASSDIIIDPFPPRKGQLTTVTVNVENKGPAVAERVHIHFGAFPFSAAPPAFSDIGTAKIDKISPGTIKPGSIKWTPEEEGHVCIKVEIGYGPDTDYSNNIASRNIGVQASPVKFLVQNTLTKKPVLIRLIPTLDVPSSGWRVTLNPPEVTLGANDCAREIEVELFPPQNTPVGSTGRVHVAAVAQTFKGPVVLGGVTVVSPQETVTKEPNILEIVFPYGIQINEQDAQVGGNGTALLSNGAVIININTKAGNFIEGYQSWPVNLGIGILSGILPAVSLQQDDAKNLLTLTHGKLDYKARVTISDEFANIITDIKVTRQKGSVVAALNSRGKAKYPHLVSLGPEPIILIQKPNPNGGFTETGEIQLVTDKGKTIKSTVVIEYFDVKLPIVQRREVTVKSLEISDDQCKVTLVGRSTVRTNK